MSMSRPLWLSCLAFAALPPFQASAGLIITAEAPGVQATRVPGVITETFDGFQPGTYTSLVTSYGTYTSPGLAIVPANVFGGANGQGRYFSVGVQSGRTEATLTLNAPMAYFGFWWSAADPQNAIEFYKDGRRLGRFNPSTALGALGASYFGNPNGGDGGEKFAYLNVIGTAGTTFDQIRFLNNNLASGFESDNHSLRVEPIDAPFPGPILIGDIAETPEPPTLAAAALGALIVAARSRRR